MTFVPFRKIPRLNRDMVITEKIDGTNAQVCIVAEDQLTAHEAQNLAAYPGLVVGRFVRPTSDLGPDLLMLAGSRNRWLSADKAGDNMGWARWVTEHSSELWDLGPGHHFGEWWGNGIQRAYGLKNGDKRFSLFATHRWQSRHRQDEVPTQEDPPFAPACCDVVPVLYRGPFSTNTVHSIVEMLRVTGSKAAPGFRKPEGIIVYHEAAQHPFKVTLDDDAKPKGQSR